jgi:hypothetical protein
VGVDVGEELEGQLVQHIFFDVKLEIYLAK